MIYIYIPYYIYIVYIIYIYYILYIYIYIIYMKDYIPRQQKQDPHWIMIKTRL